MKSRQAIDSINNQGLVRKEGKQGLVTMCFRQDSVLTQLFTFISNIGI